MDGMAAIQAIDATTLRALLSELRPALLPRRFEKAQQSDPQTLQLGLRGLEGSLWLELGWQAEAPRLHAITAPPRLGEGSTLAQQLQHSLRGLALVELHQQGWERVVEMGFARRPSEPCQRYLVLELMGRHSNLFLLDAERRVIAAARQVKPSQSRLRPIATGDPYSPPPPLSGEPPRLGSSQADWLRRLTLQPLPLGQALRQAYQGISPALVGQLLAGLPSGPSPATPVAAIDPGQWQVLWNRWQQWLEAVEGERFRFQRTEGGGYRCWQPRELSATPSAETSCAAAETSCAAAETSGAAGETSGAAAGSSAPPQPGAPASSPAGPGGQADPPAGLPGLQASPPLPIDAALAAYYGEVLALQRLAQRRAALQQRLETCLERERREARRQEELLAAVPAHADLQSQADALLCCPDPPRAVIEEAQKLYHRARRLRRSQAAITPRLALHRERAAWLEASLHFLEGCDDLVALEDLEQDLEAHVGQGRGQRAARAERRRRSALESPRPLELSTPGGLRLQVGRNHRQNDWISLRQARRGDLWFHAQECPGSHVVLKASEAPAEAADRMAAADLAAHFSRARGNRRVPVVMVAAESLQRIPGQPPGTVRHGAAEVLWGEPARALALLTAPAPAPGKAPPGGGGSPCACAAGSPGASQFDP